MKNVDGSAWKPPVMTNYTAGMPDELVGGDNERLTTKGSLSNSLVFYSFFK